MRKRAVFFFMFYFVVVSCRPENRQNQVKRLAHPKEGPSLSKKIAFLGDSALGQPFNDVLNLIKKQKSDYVIHVGDLAYDEEDPTSPHRFNAQITNVLGPNFPYLYVIGNHDVANWEPTKIKGQESYLEILQSRINNAKIDCRGKNDHRKSLGKDSYCLIDDILVVFSAIGTTGAKKKHEAFLEKTLTTFSQKKWKICAWHKNQHGFNLANKGDSVGFEAYKICQRHGAMIINGHDHVYGRTYTLKNVGDPKSSHGKTGTPSKMELENGSTFVMITGLGGHSQRSLRCPVVAPFDWWASVTTTTFLKKNGLVTYGPACHQTTRIDIAPGSAFLTFPQSGTSNSATGEFIDTHDQILDSFEITTL